jgi:hypothetical protein
VVDVGGVVGSALVEGLTDVVVVVGKGNEALLVASGVEGDGKAVGLAGVVVVDGRGMVVVAGGKGGLVVVELTAALVLCSTVTVVGTGLVLATADAVEVVVGNGGRNPGYPALPAVLLPLLS